MLRKFDNVRIIEEDQSPRRVLKRTFGRKRHSLASKINRFLFYVYFFLFIKHRLDRMFEQGLPPPADLCPHSKVNNINDPEAIQFAKEFSPDLVLVFGTSLLKDKWFTLKVPIVNSHLGIIPRYRGWMCWFWAILEGNFDSVGASIHYVTKVADGGEIIVQDFIDIFGLEKIDVPHILFAVTRLVDRNIAEAVHKILRSKKTVPDFGKYAHKTKYGHYFEPGITDYIKFVARARKLNKQLK